MRLLYSTRINFRGLRKLEFFAKKLLWFAGTGFVCVEKFLRFIKMKDKME